MQKYAQYGAGFSNPPGWINFDSSPTLRIQRIPVVGKLLGRSLGAVNFPDGIVYGDIVKGLPVAPGSLKGLYASHVLEHLTREDMRKALANSHAALEKGGLFRLIVPDLHGRAKKYLELSEQGDANAASWLMEATCLGSDRSRVTMMDRARVAFSNSAHLWMWDYPSMKSELEKAGFVDIRPAKIGDSGDSMFDRIEEPGRFKDGPFEEVAIHAVKP